MIFDTDPRKQPLKQWYISPLDAGIEDGSIFGSTDFDFCGWHSAAAPTTLLGALVDEGVFPDPRYGTTYADLPGVPVPEILDRFATQEMPSDSPFRHPRWWITEFYPPDGWELTAEKQNRTSCRAIFEGINYRAEIWINGVRVADSTQIAGTYRRHEIDIICHTRNGRNLLALKVFPPRGNDLAFSFVDWHPMPPDKCTGIWRPAHLVWFDGIRISNVAIEPAVSDDMGSADVRVAVELENVLPDSVRTKVHLSTDFFDISREVTIPAKTSHQILFSAATDSALRVPSPPLWWPRHLGEQRLFTLTTVVSSEGSIVDQADHSFAFRRITSYLNDEGNRQFKVNDVDLLIRGAAWAPDMLLKESAEKDRVDIEYIMDLGLNAVRFEANFGSDNLWSLCDRAGILILAGWTCDSQWEEYENWSEEDSLIARESLRSLLRRFRNHPSFAAWLTGSDLLAPPEIEKMYLSVLRQEAPGLVTISSAGDYTSQVTGKTGVKMSGPYSYVPPVYWYLEEMPGVATGFNTETGPDVSLPPYESLVQFFPDGEIRPGSRTWILHSGLRQFAGTDVTERAIAERYGVPRGIEDLTFRCQVLSYEAWRAMYEAALRFRPRATGIIGWMLTNAWPSMIWHLYDSLSYPTGGYFGTKKACSPLHLHLDYNQNSVWASNITLENEPGCTADISLYSIDNGGVPREEWNHRSPLELPGNSTLPVVRVPMEKSSTRLSFLDCRLNSLDEQTFHNVYWISAVPDIMTQSHEQFGTTKVARHGDMRALGELKPATVGFTCSRSADGSFQFSLENSCRYVAFFLELSLVWSATGMSVLPVIWSDNRLVLFPGEKLTVTASPVFPERITETVHGKVCGWNVEAICSPPLC